MPTKNIDYLTEDSAIPNQSWVCLSFLSPEGIRNCKIRGIKVRGTYSTKEAADARAKELQTIDPDYHVFVGEVGKWLPQDPDPNSIEDNIYREEELNKLAGAYKQNLQKVKLMEEERKNEMIASAMKNNKESKKSQKVKDRLKKKLEQRKQDEDSKTETIATETKVPTIETIATETQVPTVETAEEKEKIVEKQIVESSDKVKSIDENLNKIKELYSKLPKKNKTEKTANA